MRARLLSDKQIEWAKERYAEGYYQREIAQALYVSLQTIYIILRGTPRHKLPKLEYDGSDKHDFIKSKYFEGYQQKEIAKALGLHIATINQYVQRYNIPKKPRDVLVYDFKNEQEKC